MTSTIDLTAELIARSSVTPDDAGCQEFIFERLQPFGFSIERMPFGEVTNSWIKRGNTAPLFVFAGHTDVVPPGPTESWDTPPFEATIQDGTIYGRGCADMKGQIAAMITAVERFVTNHPNHSGSIAFLLTSDEEGPSINGTKKVVELLESRKEKIDWCIVGEPSSNKKLGDTIKNGRRGSYNGQLTVKGVQGHIAYPELAVNPIHVFGPAQVELCSQNWDDAPDPNFPPTSFQISNLRAGVGATNVIPGHLECLFNFRFSTRTTPGELEAKVRAILDKHGLKYDLVNSVSGSPFLTESGALVNAARAAIKQTIGVDTALSTTGGTSDGRFIAPTGAQVVELGVINSTIHKVNECASVSDLNDVSRIYEAILTKLLVFQKL